MRTPSPSNVTAMFDQATQTLGTAMQAGARLQGEAMRWWAGMFQEAQRLQEIERRTQAMATEIIPCARKSAAQYLMLLDHSYHRSVDLVRRALEAGQSSSYGEAQRRLLNLWQASLGALQSETQELTQVNTRVMQTLSEAAEHSFEMAAQTGGSGGQSGSRSPHSATRQATRGKNSRASRKRR